MTLATNVTSHPRRASVEPVGVGQLMPDMPTSLDVEAYVPVPLEATYQATWDSCPREMQDIIEGREITHEPDE